MGLMQKCISFFIGTAKKRNVFFYSAYSEYSAQIFTSGLHNLPHIYIIKIMKSTLST